MLLNLRLKERPEILVSTQGQSQHTVRQVTFEQRLHLTMY